MSDSVASVINSSNQLLVSTLLGGSTSTSSSLDEIVSKWASNSAVGSNSDTVNDYAELSQDALDAYQEEINKGTTYNSALQAKIAGYSYLINSNSNSNIGINADLILYAYQAKSISSLDLSSLFSSTSSEESSSDSTTSA